MSIIRHFVPEDHPGVTVTIEAQDAADMEEAVARFVREGQSPLLERKPYNIDWLDRIERIEQDMEDLARAGDAADRRIAAIAKYVRLPDS